MEARNLPTKTYDVILADPPWFYDGQQAKWTAAAKFYTLMSQEEICAIPVADLMNPKSVLFLWATGPKMHHAIEAIEAWGLHYRGVAFVWVKTTKDGKPIRAQGIRPSIVKPLTEFVLCASKIKSGRPLPLASESVVQTVFTSKREHSEKPEEIQDRIEALYPTASKLEMFARRKRKDWDIWGLEAPD